MKKVSLGVVAVACFTAVSLSAQTPPPSSDQTAGTSGSSASQSQRSDSQKVTVSGCLERSKDATASAGTSGTAGTAGASASASAESAKFVLNNVTGGTASATGTSGATATSPTASSYRLDGEDSKLTPHVGHKIEVTGTLDKSATGASMSASAPKLKVESVKMIASSCTP